MSGLAFRHSQRVVAGHHRRARSRSLSLTAAPRAARRGSRRPPPPGVAGVTRASRSISTRFYTVQPPVQRCSRFRHHSSQYHCNASLMIAASPSSFHSVGRDSVDIVHRFACVRHTAAPFRIAFNTVLSPPGTGTIRAGTGQVVTAACVAVNLFVDPRRWVSIPAILTSPGLPRADARQLATW